MVYAVLPSKAVKQGAPVGVMRLGKKLVLFRDDSGILGCLVDRCSHRGAALSGGSIVDGHVQCPFHGLQFDASGTCALVPALGRATTEDLRRFAMPSISVREKNGIVYLWNGEAGKETADLPFFDRFVDETYACSEMADEWNAHYSRCIENQIDVVHLPFVHHNTIGRGNRTIVNGPKVLFEDEMLVTSANNDVDAGQLPKPPADCVIKDTFLAFRFPNLWMNHISDRIKVIIYFAPVDDENTVLYIRFYDKISGARPINAAVAWMGKFGNRVIERQDKRVVVTQDPKASSLRSGENLIVGDGPIIMYRRMREDLSARADVG